jgi:hypothetical protein
MTRKARATVYTFVKEALADDVILAVNDGFDVETAIGAQLDIIGKYVNAARNVLGVTITSTYFDWNTYTNVATTAHGFAYYSEDPTSYFLTYPMYLERTYRITDYLLRRFIEFQAKANKLNVTLKDCDDLLFEFFGASATITDGLDMTMTYTYTGTTDLTLFQILAVSNSLPHPSGVGVTVNYV